MAPRKATPKAKAKNRGRQSRRAGSFAGWVKSAIGRIPGGVILFAIGIGLGFGLGVVLTRMAPTLMSQLSSDAVVSEGDSSKIASAPLVPAEISAAPSKSQPPTTLDAVENGGGDTANATGRPAIAEEGAHQSAVLTAPPPDEPQIIVTPDPGAREPGPPLWLRNAVAARDPGDRPMITIVLDDVGVAPQHAEMAIALPAPIVLSIMTYARNAAVLSREAQAKGHEVMVHMPMQPIDASINPGPNALTVGMDTLEIQRRVNWDLDRLSGYVGFNNHMGSRFTQDAAGMRVVLAEARRRGLLFLDSKTIAGSVGDAIAAEMGVPHIVRDVFLDDDMSEVAIARQLVEVEAIARRQGYAVAIGHPHPATIAVLKRWLPDAKARGYAIVPLTTIIKKREGVAG